MTAPEMVSGDVTPELNAALGLVVAVHEVELRRVLEDLDDLERGGDALPPEAADLHVAVRVVLAAHARR